MAMLGVPGAAADALRTALTIARSMEAMRGVPGAAADAPISWRRGRPQASTGRSGDAAGRSGLGAGSRGQRAGRQWAIAGASPAQEA